MAGDSRLDDPQLRRLRALKMVDARIHGKSHVAIAQEFNVSINTVRRALDWAKKAELVVEAEDKILSELLPAAHEAIKAVLSGTDDEVKAKLALELYKGLLPSFAKKPTGTGNVTSGTDTDLASYINTLRGGTVPGAIDGTIVPAGRLGPHDPSAEAGSAQKRLPAATSSDGSTPDAK